MIFFSSIEFVEFINCLKCIRMSSVIWFYIIKSFKIIAIAIPPNLAPIQKNRFHDFIK